MGLKGAKTVEELEAELKSVQAALSQDQAERQPKRQVPTCEDIEKELKSQLFSPQL